MWYKHVLATELEYTLFDSGAIDMKINVSLFEKKSHAKNLVLSCNSKLHWDSYTVCAAKTFGKLKLWFVIRSFFLPEASSL